MGYEAGNYLLYEIATILTNTIPSDASFFHIAGDEFVFFYKGSKEESSDLAHLLITRISEYSFQWGNKFFHTCISIGIVPLSIKGVHCQALLKAAKRAASLAYMAGGNDYMFSSDLCVYEFSEENISYWIDEIQSSFNEGRLLLYKQKIVSLKAKDTITRYEVLLRIKDRKGNVLLPNQFISFAEQYNMIYDIDRWIIKNTFAAYKEMRECGHSDARSMFAINLSGGSIFSDAIFRFIIENMELYEIPANQFCFEITESFLVRNISEAANIISMLRRYGFLFALDDFGSGISSFPYLKYLPVDYVKIDGSFIKNIVSDKTDYLIVKAIHEICTNLGLDTVGEYAETDEIIAILKELNIDYGQGFGLNAPIPILQ